MPVNRFNFSAGPERNESFFEIHYVIAGGALQSTESKLIKWFSERPDLPAWDSLELSKLGIPFEERPSTGGDLLVESLEPFSSPIAFNRGSLVNVDFGDPSIGNVNLTYEAAGVVLGR